MDKSQKQEIKPKKNKVELSAALRKNLLRRKAVKNIKKTNLLEVLRQLGGLGIQHIITTIDSDLPSQSATESIFTDSEIALTLHDEGNKGRLFKFNSW